MFKPFTHIEAALDVRRDLLDDGKVTIENRTYDVNPRIVAALAQYPAFYYGGAGDDAFPDLVMAQAVVHPDSTGVWVGHLLDKAWAAQGSSAYSPAEQLQILAFSYGFATHSAGDVWAHTLVNEFAAGPWPDFSNILDPTNEFAILNPLRHVIVEGYIGDATPGFDGIHEAAQNTGLGSIFEDSEIERTRLPDGDVSDNSTTIREIDTPHAFIFDTMINDLPDLPGHQEVFTFQIDATNSVIVDRIAELDADTSVSPDLRALFAAEDIVLSTSSAVTPIDAGDAWKVKSAFTEFIVRREVAANGSSGVDVLGVYKHMQSRGLLLDKIIAFREKLVGLRAGLPNPSTPLGEPFEDVVNRILEAGENLKRGDEVVDTDELFEDLKSVGDSILDTFKQIFIDIVNGNPPSNAELLDMVTAFGLGPIVNPQEAAAAYIDYWVGNIDRGLLHWNEFGQAFTRAIFYPQSTRDLQNQVGQSSGADAVNPDFPDERAGKENAVGVFDRLMDEIDDPNGDTRTDDSFINQYLLPMIGVPRKVAELRTGAQSFLEELEEKFLEPTRELLGPIPNPLDPLIEWLKQKITDLVKDYARDAVKEAFGIDIFLVDFLVNIAPSDLLDLESITITNDDSTTTVLRLFKPGDHAKLDRYLGFVGTSHTVPLDIVALNTALVDAGVTNVTLNFLPGARGHLKPNAEFDKEKFAAYANTVTMSKMLLLQETVAPLAPSQPRTLSKLFTDLLTPPNATTPNYYDFGLMNLNGSHGGNIMTATMPSVVDSLGEPVSALDQYPQPVSSDLWLTLIDGDQTWREDSQTRQSELYRFHEVGTGNNKVVWEFTGLAPGAQFVLQTDWAINIRLIDQGSRPPAQGAFYRIFSNGVQVGTKIIDQRRFPDDVSIPGPAGSFEESGQNWENLGTFTVGADGKLRVELSDDNFGNGTLNDPGPGEFVVAGRVRLVPGIDPAASPPGTKIVSHLTAPSGSSYAEPPHIITFLAATTANATAIATSLNARVAAQGLLDLFANAQLHESASFFTERDFIDLAALRAALVPVLPHPAGSLADFLWSSFSSLPGAAQAVLQDPFATTAAVTAALVVELNEVLSSGVSIYTPTRFTGITLLKVTEDLLNTAPTGERLVRLNRLLLEDAFRAEIARSLNQSFVVDLIGVNEWRLIRVEKVDAAISDKIAFGEEYTVKRLGLVFQISQHWRGIQYRTGSGNFPLWESDRLRPAFRTLFTDWQNGTEQFPDLGDDTTPDPNPTSPPPILFGTFPAYVPFAPTLVAPSTGTLVVSGNLVLGPLVGNQHYVNIVGNGDLTEDSLTLYVNGDVTLEGFIGGHGLKHITIAATGTITVLDGATVSSRQVLDVAGANHWDADSSGASGNITFGALLNDDSYFPHAIVIGKGANILAHASGTHAAGNVSLTANDTYAESWSFLGIDNYRWIDTAATIDVAMDARLTGFDINIQTTSETKKSAALDTDSFSTPTRAIVLGDFDGGLTDEPDLIVATHERGILRYKNVNDGFEALPTAIESGIFITTSLASGDVDDDGDLDLVAGNLGQQNRLYLNDGNGVFTAVPFGVVLNTTAVKLANINTTTPELELVVATQGEGIFLYQFNTITLTFDVTAPAIETGSFMATSIDLGDVDDLNGIDLVVGNSDHANRLYLNDGSGAFGAGADFGTMLSTTAVALANLDTDPKLELVVGTTEEGLKLHKFVGSNFGAATSIDSASSATFKTTSIALDDVDDDGNVDLVVGNRDQMNRLYMGTGNATFDAGRNITTDVRPTTAVALADIDAETGLEFVTGNYLEPGRFYLWAEVVVKEDDPNTLDDEEEKVTGYHVGKDVGIDSELVAKASLEDPLPVSKETAIAVVSEALARVTIAAGATITASHDVTLHANATAKVDLLTLKSGFGVSFADSSPTATVSVQNGVIISARNDVHMAALANNNLKLTTLVPGVGVSSNVSFSLATAHSTSLAEVANGAVITAANVDVLARNQNSFRNTAASLGFGTAQEEEEGEQSGEQQDEDSIGVSVALSFFQSLATAKVSGIITTTGDLDVDGESINDINVTRTFAHVRGGSVPEQEEEEESGQSGEAQGPLFEQVVKFVDSLQLSATVGEEYNTDFRMSTPNDMYAGAFALVTSDNHARALIANEAFVTVAGNVTIEALARDPFQISASGNAGALRPAGELSVGGALVYSTVANQASAFVSWNATVDVKNALEVRATADFVSPVAPLDLALAIAGLGDATQTAAIGAAYAYGLEISSDEEDSSLKKLLDEKIPGLVDDVLTEEEIGTSFVHAGAAAADGGLTLAGGVNIMFAYNAATAGIAKGAHVNQRSAELWSGPTDLAHQDVRVNATGSMDMVNYAGNPSVLNFISNEAKTGLGGFFDGIFGQNFATAYIDDLAIVSAARDVDVTASTSSDLTTVVFAGDYAKKFGVDGAMIYDRLKSQTLAFIEDRATVNAGRDVKLDAKDDLAVVSIAPAVAIAGNIGVGIGAAFSDVRTRTLAFIGDLADDVPLAGYGGAAGSVTAARDVALSAASTPRVWSIAAAAGVATGGGAGSPAQSTDNGSGPDSEAPLEEAKVGGTIAFGLAGSVAFNWVSQNTQAFIEDAVTVSAGHAVDLEAHSTPLLVAGAGTFAFGNSHPAIGGSFAHNELTQKTLAFIQAARVGGLGASPQKPIVLVHADSDNTILGIAASGALGNDSSVFAGGVNYNPLTVGTEAFVGHDAKVAGADVTITAENRNHLISIAGAVALASNFSFGVDAALTVIDATVHAWIGSQAVVTATGNVVVCAMNDTEIVVVSASLGLSQGYGFAGAGSYIDLHNDVQAFINGATVTAANGSVTVCAEATANILTLAAGGSGNTDFALGGSVSLNKIHDNVAAWIAGGATVLALRGVVVTAEARATVRSLSGGIGGSESIAFGVTYATNDTDNIVSAYIANATVTASAGSVTVSADEVVHLEAIAIDLAGAEKVAGAGNYTENNINDRVAAYISTGATVVAFMSVLVSATHSATIFSLGGSLAGAEALAVGVAIAKNNIANTIEAYIDHATVTASTGAVTVSADASAHLKTLGVGGAGAESAAFAGSGAFNDIDDRVAARISGGATVQALTAVVVTAAHHASIDALAGGVAGAKGVAICAAYAENTTGSTVEACIDNATVTASAGSVTVGADSTPQIRAIAVGAGGAEAFALAGSRAYNAINDTVAARISGAAKVQAAKAVLVTATDTATIRSLAGGAAGAEAVAIGPAYATNKIVNTVSAFIDNALVQSTSATVTVSAASTPKIEAYAICLAGAAGAAGGGSYSENAIGDNVNAYVATGANVVAALGVLVSATNRPTIDYLAGGAGGAAIVGIGVSIAETTTHNTVKAYVDGSTVQSIGADVVVSAASRAVISTITVGGGGAKFVGVGGAISKTTLADTIDAHIANNAIVNAGGSVHVLATSNSLAHIETGSAGGALFVGIAGADAKATLNNHTDAYVTTGSQLTAGNDVLVKASALNTFLMNSYAFAGGIAGADGAITDLVSNNNASAYVDVNAVVTHVNTLQVSADSTSPIELNGYGLAGGIGAGGTVQTRASETGTTLAYVGSGVKVGDATDPNKVVHNLTILATATPTVEVTTYAGTLGILALGLNEATAIANPTVQSFIGDAASIDVSNNLSVNSDAETSATAIDFGVISGGITFGINKADATASATVSAHVGKSTVRAGGGITVQSMNNTGKGSGATATAKSPSLTAIAYGSGVPTANARANVNTYADAGATLSAGGDITIASYATNVATSTAKALSVSAIALGTSVSSATADGTTRTHLDGVVNGAANLKILSQTSNTAKASGGALSIGGVVGTGTDVLAHVRPFVQTYIGNNDSPASVLVTGGIHVTSHSEGDASAEAKTLTGGLIGAGIVATAATLAPNIATFIGRNSVVTSTHGSVALQSMHNYSLAGTVLSGLGARATAEAAAGGLLSGTGNKASATANAITQTYASPGVTLNAAQDILLSARSHNAADTGADGYTGGLLALGKSAATTLATGTTNALLTDLGALTAGANLTVLAKGTNNASALARAASGGVVDIDAVSASAEAAPTVLAGLASTSPVKVGGTTDIKALALGNVTANAEGAGGGVVHVGTSKASATWQPTIEAYIGASTSVDSEGDIKVQAFNNFDDLGLEDSTRNVSAIATSTSGGLFDVAGAAVNVVTNSHTLAHIKAGAALSAGRTIQVLARSLNRVRSAMADGKSGSLAGSGSIKVDVQMFSQTRAVTDDAGRVNPTTLTACDPITFHAVAINDATALATGGIGGLFQKGGATATLTLTNPLSEAGLGDYTQVDACCTELDIFADNYANLQASAIQNVVLALFAGNAAAATVQILNSQTLAHVGLSVTVVVDRFKMAATDRAINAAATAKGDVLDLAGTNSAMATVVVDVNALTHIEGGGTSITAPTLVSLTAGADSVTTSAIAAATSIAITGTLTAISTNDKTVHVNVVTDAGSHITTSNLDVTVSAPPQGPSTYVNTATAPNNTLASLVVNILYSICYAAAYILSGAGVLFDPAEKCTDIAEFIQILLGNQVIREELGASTVISGATLNHSLTIPDPDYQCISDCCSSGGIEPITGHVLVIDVTGKVVELSGITASNGATPLSVGQTITTGSIFVDNVKNTKTAAVDINVPGGFTRGSSTIDYRGSFKSVTISNASPIALFIKNIEVDNLAKPPAITQTAAAGEDQWEAVLTANPVSPTVNITSNSPRPTDINLTGHIYNPVGITTIRNANGNIVTTGPSAYISTLIVDLKASGTIGSDSQPVFLLMAASTPNLEARIDGADGKDGVFLDVTAMGAGSADQLTIAGGNIHADNGDVVIRVHDGSKRVTVVTNRVTLTNGGTMAGSWMHRSFDPALAVNNTTGAIDLGHPHGMTTGYPIVYLANNGVPIAGLRSGGVYRVIATKDSTAVQLGETFDASRAVNSAQNTIKLPVAAHLFFTGDKVVYDNGGNRSIGGLTQGQAYYVKYFSNNSIMLYGSLEEAEAKALTFDPKTAVTGNAITFASATGFATGQAVTYSSERGAAFRNLVSGNTYFAIVVNPTTIMLAASAAAALASNPIELDASATGTQSIGAAGVLLDAKEGATGTQSLRFDINGTEATGMQQLANDRVYLEIAHAVHSVPISEVAEMSVDVQESQVPIATKIALSNISSGRTTTIHAGDSTLSEVTLTGELAAAGGLVKTGAGLLELSGSNTYTGPTTVNAGTLQANTPLATGSAGTTVNSGATLTGAGTLQALTVAGGAVSPGKSGPGSVDAGNISFSSASTFVVQINGATAGTEYDQLNVSGRVSLGGATLDASMLAGFTPPIGATFLIVNNDDTDPVDGTFANLSEGSTVTLAGVPFAISYVAGTGNDVVLTRLSSAILSAVATTGKVYDGSMDASSLRFVLSGVEPLDDVRLLFVTATFASKDVGTGKTVTLVGVALSGVDAGKYRVDSTLSTPADITPLSISATVTVADKVYDGSTAATLTGRQLLGVRVGDDVSLVGGAAAFDNQNAGAGKNVAVASLGLSGADAANYKVTGLAAATAGITPASLTVTVDHQTMTEGGVPPTVRARFAGFVNGENDATLSGMLVGTTAATSGSPAGNYAVTGSGLANPNYTINYVAATRTILRDSKNALTAPVQIRPTSTLIVFKNHPITVGSGNLREMLKVTLSTTLGKFTLANFRRLGVTVKNNGTGRLVITGRRAAINRALKQLSLTLKDRRVSGRVIISMLDARRRVTSKSIAIRG